MANQTEIIKELRDVLKRVKNELYVNGIVNDDLFEQAFNAFALIKEHQLTILTKEIYDLLDHEDAIIRKEAIALLGFSTRLHVPEFRDKAYEIFLNDQDESVKSTALRAWASYYFKSDDKRVLKILYSILLDETQHAFVRADAYVGIYTTISDLFTASNSIKTTPLIKSKTPEQFNSHVDWQEVKNILLKYAPEVLLDLGVHK